MASTEKKLFNLFDTSTLTDGLLEANEWLAKKGIPAPDWRQVPTAIGYPEDMVMFFVPIGRSCVPVGVPLVRIFLRHLWRGSKVSRVRLRKVYGVRTVAEVCRHERRYFRMLDSKGHVGLLEELDQIMEHLHQYYKDELPGIFPRLPIKTYPRQ